MFARHPYLCRCDDCAQLDDNEWRRRHPIADMAITEDNRLVALYIPRDKLKAYTVATWHHHDDDTCTIEREDFVGHNPNQAIRCYMDTAGIPDDFKFTRNTHPAGGGQ